MEFCLSRKEIEWAWKKRCEGHGLSQIADALHVHYRTLSRALMRVYGRTGPSVYIPLVYKE